MGRSCPGELSQDPEAAEHGFDLLGHGHVGDQQRALALQLREQPLLTLLFGPLLVRADAEVRGDGVHGVSVTLQTPDGYRASQGTARMC